MPKILALHNSTGSRAWRLVPQLYYLNKQHGWEVALEQGSQRTTLEAMLAKVDWCDVLMYQSVFDNKVFDYAKSKGKKIIFEFDDLLDEVPENHPEFKRVQQKDFQDGVHKVLSQANTCITTNEFLQKQYLPINPNIHVFPNYMDFDFWERPLRPRPKTNTIRLGWAGSLSHAPDLMWIMPVIKQILEEYPQVKFYYCGAGGIGGSAWSQFNYGKDLFPDIPADRREHVMGSPLESWPDKLNSLQFDIAIAPVIDHRFNRCKTNIKWMEYAVNKVPSVCQDFLYGDIVEPGKTGYLAKTEGDYFTHLKTLIENETLRKQIGQNAYEAVKKYDINNHLEEWAQIVINK